MGFLKKLGGAVGGFAKKIASSGIGRTLLSGAATAVAGPAAGAGVLKLTGMIGEKKTGEMAAKIVSDGTVKVDKIQSTLAKYGIQPDGGTLDEVVQSMKAAASGIGNKSISISGSNLIAPSSGSGGSSSPVAAGNFMEKVKNGWYRSVEWVKTHWKQIALFGLLPLTIIVAIYFLVFKNKKYRR